MRWIAEVPGERAERRAQFRRRVAAIADDTAIERMAQDLRGCVRDIFFEIWVERRHSDARSRRHHA
jgi:hypothetical protein